MRAAGWMAGTGALLALALSVQPACAVVNARTAAAQAVTTKSWGLVPATGAGSLVAVGPATGVQYVTLNSTGAALDSRFTETIEVRTASALAVGQVLVRSCSGTWDANGGCSGTATTLDSTSTAPTPVHLDIPAGGQVHLQVVPVQISLLTSVSISAAVRN